MTSKPRFAPVVVLFFAFPYATVPLSASAVETVTLLLSSISVASLTSCSHEKRPDKRRGIRSRADNVCTNEPLSPQTLIQSTVERNARTLIRHSALLTSCNSGYTVTTVTCITGEVLCGKRR